MAAWEFRQQQTLSGTRGIIDRCTKGSRCIPSRACRTYLRSEVGAVATDANADNPGSDVVPGLRPRFSCLESSGGNVVDGGVESEFPCE